MPVLTAATGTSLLASACSALSVNPVAPPTVAARVLAILADGSMFPGDSTAEVEAATVDCGSVAVLDATLCPPTVGNHPLVPPKPSCPGVFGVEGLVFDLCEVCRGDTSVGDGKIVFRGEVKACGAEDEFWLSRDSRASLDSRDSR